MVKTLASGLLAYRVYLVNVYTGAVNALGKMGLSGGYQATARDGHRASAISSSLLSTLSVEHRINYLHALDFDLNILNNILDVLRFAYVVQCLALKLSCIALEYLTIRIRQAIPRGARLKLGEVGRLGDAILEFSIAA